MSSKEIRASDFSPHYGLMEDAGNPRSLETDPEGHLNVRAQILTDEITSRIQFANSALAVSLGDVTVSGDSVIGSGFSALDIKAGDYFKVNADAETAWLQIAYVVNDSKIQLEDDYVGAASGAASFAKVKTATGSGGSIAVASGQCTLTSGTTNSARTGIYKLVDYAPLVYRAKHTISQRVANQTIYSGLREEATTVRWFAYFQFDGTTNTTVKCVTGRNPSSAPSASETQTSTITLPNGLTTATSNDYRIELLQDMVRFFIAGVLVAEHNNLIPGTSDVMLGCLEVLNGTGASSTNVVADFMSFKNHNKIECAIFSDAEKIIAAPPPGTVIPAVTVAANNTDFIVLDCLQIRAVMLQVSSVGGGATISFQGSNDPAFGATISLLGMPAGGGAFVSSTTAVGHWIIPVLTRYLRIRTTAYTSGSIIANAVALQDIPAAMFAQTTYNGTQGINISQIAGGTAVNGGLTGSMACGGTAANDAAATGNPVQVGGVCRTDNPTTIVNGDAAAMMMTTGRAAVMKSYSIPENDWTYSAAASGILNTTTAVTFKAAGAASIRNYVTGIDVFHEALTNATELAIRDGASGTVIWRTKIQSGAAGRFSIRFASPLKGTAATLMEVVTLSASGAGAVYFNAQGYQTV